VLASFLDHYYHERNHQGLDNRLIEPEPHVALAAGPIDCRGLAACCGTTTTRPLEHDARRPGFDCRQTSQPANSAESSRVLAAQVPNFQSMDTSLLVARVAAAVPYAIDICGDNIQRLLHVVLPYIVPARVSARNVSRPTIR
jgi:hypothetical protein